MPLVMGSWPYLHLVSKSLDKDLAVSLAIGSIELTEIGFAINFSEYFL